MSHQCGRWLSLIAKRVGNSPLLLVTALALSLSPTTIWAQNNPTFVGGGKLPNTTNGSPAMATISGKTCMAYQDASTGNLAVVQSTDGVTWGGTVNTGFSMYNSIVAATNYNNSFYVLITGSLGFEETTSSDCTTFTTPQTILVMAPSGYNFSYQPGLAVWTPPGGSATLYLSLNVPYSTGYAAGLLSSTNGSLFNNFQIPAYTTINSGSALITYTPSGASSPNLYQAFTQGPYNNPEIAQTSNGTTWTAAADTSFEVGGDPNMVVFTASGSSSAIYLFGRSNYSANNLWVTATYDGATFTPAYKYGMSLHFSPSSIISPTNNLVSSFHSNFSSNNLWSYYAPY